MRGRHLQTLIALVLAGFWGVGVYFAHAHGHLGFLDRIESTMTDLRTLVRGTAAPPDQVTIVAENGARFTLQDRDGNGRVDSAELSSKALLLDAPKKQGGNRFQVITPQAIAAVRGTKWAVDAAEGKTSVFVVNGRVAVGRRTGTHSVTLGAGEGVDVEATRGPLTVKRWPKARVAALMARLGQ